MASPPKYTSENQTSFSRSTFGIGSCRQLGYEAVPLNDEQLEEQTESLIKCKASGFAIYIDKRDIRNADHLESFIRKYQPSPPSFALRIKAFRAPRSDETAPRDAEEEARKYQIFTFSVPLPTLSKSSCRLYSKAHDVPCLRGKLKETQALTSLGEKGWTSQALQGSEIYDTVTRQNLQASILAKEKWNSRVEKLTQPWLSLDESIREESLSEEGIEKKAERTLNQNLTNFLMEKSKAKWLICPQTLYGWDLPLILEKLRTLVPEESPSTAGESQTPSISHIKISIDSPPPFLAVKVLSKSQMLFFKALGELSADSLVAAIMSFVAVGMFDFVCFVFCLAKGDSTGIGCGADGKSWIPTHWAFWLLNFVTLVFLVLVLQVQENYRVYDGVGLAWNLKRVGRGLNEDGAQELKSGVEEQEWVEKHSVFLRRAIKERRTGDLRNEWPEDD